MEKEAHEPAASKPKGQGLIWAILALGWTLIFAWTLRGAPANAPSALKQNPPSTSFGIESLSDVAILPGDRRYCIGLADRVNQLYMIYRSTYAERDLSTILDSTAASDYQRELDRSAIAFAVKLPANLPESEPGKQWLQAHCN